MLIHLQLAAMVLLVMFGAACNAQTEPAYESLAKGEDEVSKALNAFLDAQAAAEERLLAGEAFGVVTGEADVARLIETIGDKSQDERVRNAALQKLPSSQIAKQIQVFDSILNDPAASAALKVAVVDRLHILTNFTYRGAENRDQLLQLMRAQIKHDNAEVRSRMMGYLALTGDDAAIDTLAESVGKRDVALFPVDEQIGYLALRRPRDHYAILRPYIDDENEKAQAAAVYALAQDEASQPKIRELFQGESKSKSTLVRKACSKILARYDNSYPEYALEVLENEQEGNAIRAQIIRDLGAGLQSQAYSQEYEPRIRETVEEIEDDEEAPAIKAAVQDFKEADSKPEVNSPAPDSSGGSPLKGSLEKPAANSGNGGPLGTRPSTTQSPAGRDASTQN